MSGVVLHSLVKRFGTTTAVDNLSLEIESGSFTTILGPSGCGKTTTLRMLAGFLNPDEGDILVNGVSVKNTPPNKRPTSIVFQDYAVFPHMTVFQNVAYGLRAQRVKKEEINERVSSVLDLLGMKGLGGRYANELSGGQQQRVALARSLVLRPEVLLMDEPLSNLDAKLRASVSHELKQLQKHVGITTIYVTHDQTEALSMSDKIAIMKDGKLEQYASPQEVYYNPATPFVAGFMGQANFIDGIVEDKTEDSYMLKLGGHILRVATQGQPKLNKNQKVKIMIRPEALRIVDADTGITGAIQDRMFYGTTVKYWVTLNQESVIVNQPVQPHERMYEGTVNLDVDLAWIKVFPE